MVRTDHRAEARGRVGESRESWRGGTGSSTPWVEPVVVYGADEWVLGDEACAELGRRAVGLDGPWCIEHGEYIRNKARQWD